MVNWKTKHPTTLAFTILVSSLVPAMDHPYHQENCPNITYFLKFSSWTYNGNQLGFVEVGVYGITLQDDTTSAKWRMVETSSQRDVDFYPYCPGQYPYIRTTIVFQDYIASFLSSMFQFSS